MDIKLLQGDCLEIMKDIPDGSVDLVVTDPPYPTTSRGSAGNSGGMLQKEINKKGKVFEHNSIHCRDYAPEFYRLLKDGSHCYIMTNHVNLNDMMTAFCTHSVCLECGNIEWNKNFNKCPLCSSKNVKSQNRFHYIKSLVWDKGNKIMGQYYMSQYEYILFFRKGKGIKINNCGTSDILSVPNKKTKDSEGKNIHDTEKPIGLMETLIENSSSQGDLVLDPFLGVGSTGVACINTNRKFIGIELDDKYFEIAKERIESHEVQP